MRQGRPGAAIALGFLVSMFGCGGGDAAPASAGGSLPSASGSPTGDVVVPERWIARRDTLWDLDTPALWSREDEGRLYVTSKRRHQLLVLDGASGQTVGTLGQEGSGLGFFERPNGVAVTGDLALVVERDNHRVQVLSVPTGVPLGTFGEKELERPYGLTVGGELPDPTVWITDNYEAPAGTGDLTHRLHRFRIHVDGGRVVVRDHQAFGGAEGVGALEVVESIAIDPRGGRLLVADEARKLYVVYDSSGLATGETVGQGRIGGDPEGIALVACADGSGYWIANDQQAEVSRFLLFRRDDLGFVGRFQGSVTANTDGVAFVPGPSPGFPEGVLYAVHDDQAVSAFDWGDVRRAMGSAVGCG